MINVSNSMLMVLTFVVVAGGLLQFLRSFSISPPKRRSRWIPIEGDTADSDRPEQLDYG